MTSVSENGKKPVIRRQYHYRGRVQGVGFRWRARCAAQAFGVTGWVENEYDGSVVLELQGDEGQIARVIASVERGRYLEIDDCEAKAVPPVPDERGFSVRG